MRRVFLLAVLILPLGACVSSQASSGSYDPELDGYLRCNLAASRLVARQPGDPSSLAVAAREMCTKEFVALRNAVEGSMPVSSSLRVMEIFRTRAVETNIGWIVQERLRASAPVRVAPQAKAY